MCKLTLTEYEKRFYDTDCEQIRELAEEVLTEYYRLDFDTDGVNGVVSVYYVDADQHQMDAFEERAHSLGFSVQKQCPSDTDGDGNCGRPACPVCHPEKHQKKIKLFVRKTPFRYALSIAQDMDMVLDPDFDLLDQDGQDGYKMTVSVKSKEGSEDLLDKLLEKFVDLGWSWHSEGTCVIRRSTAFRCLYFEVSWPKHKEIPLVVTKKIGLSSFSFTNHAC